MSAQEAEDKAKPSEPEPKPEPEPAPKSKEKTPAVPAGFLPQAQATETADAKPKKKKKAVEAAVKLEHLTKRFGDKIAVDNLSLNIRAGWIYGLIGPNGAGKTTTFSMMAGYLKPTEGQVEMLGYEPTQIDELRSRFGVLPQDAMLPTNDKVGEFMIHMARLQDIPGNKAISAARDALQEVNGMDWWDMRCGTLSHGMAKRVALAQALIGEPEVVLLDEPTAGLDPRVAYDVRQLVKSRKGRCTVIISSHNLLELEEICDAAAVLDYGKLVASGTMSELTAASEEVHVRIGPPPRGSGQSARAKPVLPMDDLRKIPGVTRVDYDDDTRDLCLSFERKTTDGENVIGHSLWILLNAQVRISAVTKGRGLEARVMDLTDD